MQNQLKAKKMRPKFLAILIALISFATYSCVKQTVQHAPNHLADSQIIFENEPNENSDDFWHNNKVLYHFLPDSIYKSSLGNKPLSKGTYIYKRSGSNTARLAISPDPDLHGNHKELLLYLKFTTFYGGKFQTVPYFKGEKKIEGNFKIIYLKAETSSQSGA